MLILVPQEPFLSRPRTGEWPIRTSEQRHSRSFCTARSKSIMTRIVSTLLLYLAVSLHSSPAASLQVNTTAGTFIGQSISSGLDRWLGIPFAEPPVGSLRFKAPVPIAKPSSIVRNASTFGNACPQQPSDSLGAPMSEDCLFLNVSGRAWNHPSSELFFRRCSVQAMFPLPRNSRHLSGST